MKSTIAIIAIALSLVGSALAQDQPQPARGTNDAPVIAGIYYHSPTGYVRMELAVNTGDKNVIPLAVARVPNSNNLTIVPQADLPAGEYLLIADQGKGYDGYDFGVK